MRRVSTSSGCRKPPTLRPSRSARIPRSFWKAGAISLQGLQDANHLAAILVGAPSLGGKPVGNNRFYGANDPRRNTGLSLGY